MKKLLLSFSILSLLILSNSAVFSQVQNALNFDGTDDYVDIGNNASLLFNTGNSITIEAWIYPDNVTGYHTIAANRSTETVNIPANWALRTSLSGNTVDFYYRHSDDAGWDVWTSTVTLTVGVWQHVALTFTYGNSGSIAFYKNGVLSGGSWTTGTGNSAPYQTTQIARIGAIGGLTQFWDGLLDELRIWNDIRTQNEIRSEMHRELLNPAAETNLVAYYQFDQTSGTNLPNLSSLSPVNNGTLNNFNVPSCWVTSTAPIPYYSVVNGNWNINGTWAAGQNSPVNAWSRVKVKNQVYLTANTTTEELTVDPSSSLTVNPGIFFTVNGTITNNAGNSGLVIKSDATGRGSLINNTASVPATVETYITANRWHFISAPIANALSGIFTTYYLQRHQEAGNYYLDIIPTYVPLNVMQGYALWAGTNNTFNYAGTLNSGSQNYGLTRNHLGWNLTGNPYPSSIDWDAASGWTKTNVNNAVYLENNGGWATYIAGVGTNGGTRYIAPGQGFFVNCNTNPGSLAMTNAVRVHNATAFFKDEVSDMVRLSVAGNEYTDEMVVRFLGEASEAFDGNFDAYKLASLDAVPELFSFAGTDELAINALPETQLVQLGFRCQEGGSYTISAAEIMDIANVVLEDKLSGTFTDLNTANHTFTYQAGDDANRFVLHFTPLSIEQQNVNPFGVYASGKSIYLNTDQKAQVNVFDLLGKQLKTVAVGSGSSSIEVSQSGIYLVRIQSAGQTFTTKINIQ